VWASLSNFTYEMKSRLRVFALTAPNTGSDSGWKRD
jgi:hypothetical protein